LDQRQEFSGGVHGAQLSEPADMHFTHKNLWHRTLATSFYQGDSRSTVSSKIPFLIGYADLV
jgi:hypothetical protein